MNGFLYVSKILPDCLRCYLSFIDFRIYIYQQHPKWKDPFISDVLIVYFRDVNVHTYISIYKYIKNIKT